MSRHRWEIERQPSKVSKRLLPSHRTPSKRQERVGEHKHQHRRHHAQQSTAVERRHSVARLHRHKQECRNYHKQRHTYASERAIVESHPKAIVVIGKHRHIAGKPRCIGTIEILTCVHQHHQEACHHAHIIDKRHMIVVAINTLRFLHFIW